MRRRVGSDEDEPHSPRWSRYDAFQHINPRLAMRSRVKDFINWLRRFAPRKQGELWRTLKKLCRTQDALKAAVADLQRDRQKDIVERVDVLTEKIDVLVEQTRVSHVVANQMIELSIADREWRDRLDAVHALTSLDVVGSHVSHAIDSAVFEEAPIPHVVIHDLLPQDMYEALLTFLPPRAFFQGLDSRPNKGEVVLPIRYGPEASLATWNFMHELTQRVVIPALARKFERAAREYMHATFPGRLDDDVSIVDNFTFIKESRIFLRGPGYTLMPHRDPKWGFVTCLFYLARLRDRPEYGTQLYAVEEDEITPIDGVYYPDESRCRSAKMVPFKPNTALAFLNSVGAHGASVPPSAHPVTERYLYSIRFGPNSSTRERLLAAPSTPPSLPSRPTPPA